MSQYFQVKVQFVNEDNKKQSVNYLVDAMSVTEAEAKTIQYLTNEGEDTFEVKAASESKIAQVISVLEVAE
jgi:lipopolysaccharide export LptBFGC system permease protein LptF